MFRRESRSRGSLRWLLIASAAVAQSCALTAPRTAQAPAQRSPNAPVDDAFRPETGPFVGVSGVWTTIGGDFDGNSVLIASDNSETASLPSIDAGFGGRIATGWRWTKGAVELAYQRTTHDGEFLGMHGIDVTYSSVDVDGRFYLPSFSERLKPSVLAGIVFPWLDVDNGVTQFDANGSVIDVGTARYTGIGMNFGVGADFYVTRHWSIDLLAIYRWTDFTYLSGIDHDGSIHDDVNGSGFILGVGTSWTF